VGKDHVRGPAEWLVLNQIVAPLLTVQS
jgi:hypothetical protein